MTNRIGIHALMVHPFFDEIDFSSDLSQLGVEQMLEYPEPPKFCSRGLLTESAEEGSEPDSPLWQDALPEQKQNVLRDDQVE